MAELRFAYAARGYDYASAIERVAGDEELLHSLLDMFAADSSFSAAESSFAGSSR